MIIDDLLTVVIPCKNEGVKVLDVIELVSNQVNCQIIVADSSDEDTSISLLREYKKNKKTIRIVKGGMPAFARNAGAKLVTTPFVLFLDADTYLINSITIHKCLTTIVNSNYDLVTCKFTTDKEFNWVYKAFNIIQWYSSKTKPFCLGGFMMFRIETFNKLQGFNEKDKIAEDYHISSKIKPRNFKIVDDYVFTPSRRFQKKGVWYMIKLALDAWINRNNDNWFEKDYNYFS